MKRLLLIFALLVAGRAHAQQCFPEIQCRVTAPIVQRFTSTTTNLVLLADRACGTSLLLDASSAGGTVTSATPPFPAPDSNNSGCVVVICNIGTANNVVVKRQTSTAGNGFLTTTGADITMVPKSCMEVTSPDKIMTSPVWLQSSALASDS